MKIFLAGNGTMDYLNHHSPFILQTFYDMRKMDESLCRRLVYEPDMFLLDSGAFTFMNRGITVNWRDYANEYIDFINRYDVRYFFELDLDTVIGVEKTRQLTAYIEGRTRKQSIPVFHACRGLDRWREMCQTYGYVAIGASGVTEECRWVKNDRLLKQMVSIAHSYGSLVHGLGYTRLNNLNNTTIPFDSVDSTSVLSGQRFGTMYLFAGEQLISKSIKGRVKDYRTLSEHNVIEWIKMQRFKEGL